MALTKPLIHMNLLCFDLDNVSRTQSESVHVPLSFGYEISAMQLWNNKRGFNNYEWDRYIDGVTFGGFGIITTPRELAKIALCVANEGVSNNEQMVSSSWIEDMTTSQIEPDGDYSFGYYWWIDPSRNIHFMWGHGGQFAFIYPEKDLLVVMTSIPNTQGDYQIYADEALKVVDKIVDISD